MLNKFLIWINDSDNQYDFIMYFFLFVLIIMVSPVFFYSL